MHYIIYIDVLFVVNFIMDYIVLSITAGILTHTTTMQKTGGSKRNLCLDYIKRIGGSAVGAVWACALLWFGLHEQVWNVLTYIMIGPLMVLILMGKSKITSYLKGVGILYIVTFVLGGAVHFIYYYTYVGYFLYNITAGGSKTTGVWLIVAGVIIGGGLIEWFSVYLVEKRKNSNSIYTVIVENGSKSVKLLGLCDTGNGLYDPFYGECVSVVLANTVSKLLDESENSSYHLIPFSAIGNENGLIPVVRMSRLKIICQKEFKIVEKPLLALYSGKFARKTQYELIIHPDMIKETKG